MWSFKQNIYKSSRDAVVNPCSDCIAHDVPINTQIWAGCNATVSTYRDTTLIPEVTDPIVWGSLTTGAWCWYNNDPANETTYGKLYNWYAVAGIYDAASLADPLLRKEFAPTGYHVATDTEWTELTTFLGGSLVAGGELKDNTLCYWNAPNTGATNSVGFRAFGGGYRNDFASDFFYLKTQAYYWTSTPFGVGAAFNRFIYSYNGNINRFTTSIREGYSVRLVKD